MAIKANPEIVDTMVIAGTPAEFQLEYNSSPIRDESDAQSIIDAEQNRRRVSNGINNDVNIDTFSLFKSNSLFDSVDFSSLYDSDHDWRAILKPRTDGTYSTDPNRILGADTDDNILKPLLRTGGLLFPYTPVVTSGGVAVYDNAEYVYSNYKINAFKNSYPMDINITAKFTAGSEEEARYMLAMMAFLRAVTKNEFGKKTSTPGLPPPPLTFNYLGDDMYQDIPVVVLTYSFSLEPDVNYVKLTVGDTDQYLPAITTLNLTLAHNYNPLKVRTLFNLADFKSGKLLGGYQ